MYLTIGSNVSLAESSDFFFHVNLTCTLFWTNLMGSVTFIHTCVVFIGFALNKIRSSETASR